MSIKWTSEVAVVGDRGVGGVLLNRLGRDSSQGRVAFWGCCGFGSKSNNRGLGMGLGGRWVCRTGLCQGHSPSDGSPGPQGRGGLAGGTATPLAASRQGAQVCGDVYMLDWPC